MKKNVWFGVCLLILVFALAASFPHSQVQGKPAADEAPKTAEQQFKNIQVLKGIPADQLIPTMQFIAASLGVECEFCHVEHQMDKDDKKEKKTARHMMEMEITINKENFDGNLNVTCYTCHRGAAHPVGIPILGPDAPKTVPHSHDPSAHANLPSADDLLNKYLAAVGGADALNKIHTRVQKGTIDAMGHKSEIEVYSEAPEKRVSVSKMPTGTSITAFNGEVGWLTIPNGSHRMTAQEREAARIDAELHFPVRVREMYKQFRVMPGDPINGHDTYLVSATGGDAHPALRLYFDQQTGLLARLIRYAETPLGRLPTQVDYADYKDADGVKIPYQWTLWRPNGSFIIHITDVQQNVPIDEKLFEPPAEEKR
jgi:photosynthetic reaction center cytochrome c subunit